MKQLTKQQHLDRSKRLYERWRESDQTDFPTPSDRRAVEIGWMAVGIHAAVGTGNFVIITGRRGHRTIKTEPYWDAK